MPWPAVVLCYVAVVTVPSAVSARLEESGSSWGAAALLDSWLQDASRPEPQSTLDRPQWIQDQDAEQWQPRDTDDRPWSQGNPESKRALSVLSRWRPLTDSLAPRRFAARSPMPRSPSQAFVRPIGQPLRWGRR